MYKFYSAGTLHVGDEIREINGVSVINQTVETLQKMLVRISVNTVGPFKSASKYAEELGPIKRTI